MTNPTVVVIGAGPAGLYATKTLLDAGTNVLLVNRDIKPGGLAKYGIFVDKYKMKFGLQKQFNKILSAENLTYLGNVTVGNEGDITLEQLRQQADAVLVTTGAQGTKMLGIEGEDLPNVHHAKQLVYHYNGLPPFSEQEMPLGKRVLIVGAGNVSIDIARYVIHHLHVDEVIATVRRDASAVKFTKKEFSYIYHNMDQEALVAEIDRTRERMEAVELDVDGALAFIHSAEKKALPTESPTRFTFQFLSVVSAITQTDTGLSVELSDTYLELREDGRTKPVLTGTKRFVEVDSVVFAIGDSVDETFGLSPDWNGFLANPSPQYPIDGKSYEAFNAETEQPHDGIFIAGWAREASTGLVGVARKDGTNGANVVLQYVQDLPSSEKSLASLVEHLQSTVENVVTLSDLEKIVAEEARIAAEGGNEHFQFVTNQEMIQIITNS